jgi:HD-GYP domain-containing protein (c-di-GMP phosphodiesterase class II)
MIDWCPAVEAEVEGGATSRTERRLLALALVGEVEARRETPPARSRRAADVARALARRVGWSERACALLHEAALLQDVGYSAVPGELLAADGPLDEVERSTLELHPVFGVDLLRGVLRPEQLGWVRHHHERWDGAGYPDGLSGNDIPEGASLILLATAWATMTHDRPGRPALSPEEALRECRAQAGRQFRPSSVAALAALARGRRGRAGLAPVPAQRIAC